MKVGFTAGAFDLLHAGHISMFQEAKTVCDYLIVGLHADPSKEREIKNTPIQSVVERQIVLKACVYVDEIIVYETEEDLEDILSTLHLDIRIIGEDHRGGFLTGGEICRVRGIEVYYNERKHMFSSSFTRSKI